MVKNTGDCFVAYAPRKDFEKTEFVIAVSRSTERREGEAKQSQALACSHRIADTLELCKVQYYLCLISSLKTSS